MRIPATPTLWRPDGRRLDPVREDHQRLDPGAFTERQP